MLVDFHSHVLPGADHGSDSIETTLFQLSNASARGINRIIATPHFYPNSHSVDEFLKRRNTAYQTLAPHLNDTLPKIKLGAEVLICNGIENLPGLEKLFVQGTSTLLLELPFSDFQYDFCNSVYNLTSNGVNVVLAHAERYPSQNIEMLIENGAKIQLNAFALCKMFIRRKIKDWLNRGLVVALGSDIHGCDRLAYGDFLCAVKKLSSHFDFIKTKSDKIWDMAKFYN